MAKAKRAYVCNDCGADFPAGKGSAMLVGRGTPYLKFVLPLRQQ